MGQFWFISFTRMGGHGLVTARASGYETTLHFNPHFSG